MKGWLCILLCFFIFSVHLSGQDSADRRIFRSHIEASTTLYSWHNRYNQYNRENFDPALGLRVGWVGKLDSRRHPGFWTGGNIYFNYLRNYSPSSGDETLNFYTLQLKAGPGYDWGPLSFDFMAWYQYILGFHKNNAQPPGFGIIEQGVHKHGFGLALGIDYQLFSALRLVATYEYGLTSAYEMLIVQFNSPLEYINNHPNWFNFGLRWNFVRKFPDVKN